MDIFRNLRITFVLLSVVSLLLLLVYLEVLGKYNLINHESPFRERSISTPALALPTILRKQRLSTSAGPKEIPCVQPTVPNSVASLSSKLMGIVANERVSALHHGCRNIKKGNVLSFDQIFMLPKGSRPRFYFSDKYKIVICEIPKCGSTSWKKALITMEHEINETLKDKIPGGTAHEVGKKRDLWVYFNESDPKSVAKTKERILNYTRIITVREPLERLVSAYKDKMLPTGSGGTSYGTLSSKIHEAYRNTSMNSTLKTVHASWEEFIRYLLDDNRKIYIDAHWEKFSELCFPCSIDYHYVAKLETIYHDVNYLSSVLGYDLTPFFPAAKESGRHRKWGTEYIDYFWKLPVIQRQKLYDMYFSQYHMFGYSKPSFL